MELYEYLFDIDLAYKPELVYSISKQESKEISKHNIDLIVKQAIGKVSYFQPLELKPNPKKTEASQSSTILDFGSKIKEFNKIAMCLKTVSLPLKALEILKKLVIFNFLYTTDDMCLTP